MSESENLQQIEEAELTGQKEVEVEEEMDVEPQVESESSYGRPPTNKELWMVVVIIVALLGVLIAQHGL